MASSAFSAVSAEVSFSVIVSIGIAGFDYPSDDKRLVTIYIAGTTCVTIWQRIKNEKVCLS
ncbi:hypothetical protein B2M27_00710 [Kluyvera intermedia]|uniref:Uncharacterized protein n=2 Tax=Enterobacteriaceae TaxID=543 RepID=A0AAC8TPE1_9ENTR|nr:hypothetical protein AB182_25890 [Phytobacter ursingii]ORJ52241.1 hypothetical protein B2M27_00710 [Kluyvera intermedia]